MSRNRGFTLIEVMITVAIVAILARIAFPAYTDYIRRGQVQDAFTALSDYRVKMEQYYQDNRNYGATTGTVCATDATASSWSGFAATKYFTYACTTSSSGQAYSIVATGASGQAVNNVYTINQAGTQGTTKYKNNAVSASCWLVSSSTC